MEDSEIYDLDVQTTFEAREAGINIFTCTAQGVEIRVTYTNRDAATALVLALPDVLYDASTAVEEGDYTELPPSDPFDIEGLELE